MMDDAAMKLLATQRDGYRDAALKAEARVARLEAALSEARDALEMVRSSALVGDKPDWGQIANACVSATRALDGEGGTE